MAMNDPESVPGGGRGDNELGLPEGIALQHSLMTEMRRGEDRGQILPRFIQESEPAPLPEDYRVQQPP